MSSPGGNATCDVEPIDVVDLGEDSGIDVKISVYDQVVWDYLPTEVVHGYEYTYDAECSICVGKEWDVPTLDVYVFDDICATDSPCVTEYLSTCSAGLYSQEAIISDTPGTSLGDYHYVWNVYAKCTCLISQIETVSTWVIHVNFTVHVVDTIPPCSGGEGQSFYSKMARFSDWGFDIPLDAEIHGIQVNISKHCEPNSIIFDSVVKIMKNHRIVGKNRAISEKEWDVETTALSYGNIVDMWGIDKITPEEINSNGFGVAFEAEDASNNIYPLAYLDGIEMLVFYKKDDKIFIDSKILDFNNAVYPLF